MPGRRGVSPVRRSRSDPGDRHVVAGGGYARKRLTGLTPGASITVTVTVTIGAGGTAGTTGGAAPTNGAASSFAGSGFTTVSATGGVINPLNSPTSPGLGNLAGVGSGGDLNLYGGDGGSGMANQSGYVGNLGGYGGTRAYQSR